MVSLRKYVWEGIGWLGALFSLLAFSLNSLNVIGSQSVEYLGANIVGCFFLILYAVSKKAHASWVLNTIFLLMAVFALVRVYVLHL
ncbi:CBU_0592 family membrane protein [Pontibacter chitinilyticus]|uniref:CBU_0592 family membrane protein n=1 Tax=Pontibacter chitinilyticus TaxID=2674989 RepID=UPI00321BD511